MNSHLKNIVFTLFLVLPLYSHVKVFDFNDKNQLIDLPSFGKDSSFIENGKLKSTIYVGKHKGLGRKFWFKNYTKEPNEAKIEFDIFVPNSFQKNGTCNELGKFSGFEGIYDNSAGWGGKKVTNQNSWSVRIAHTCENNKKQLPIWLYVYHPQMTHKYGTSINPNFALNKKQIYTLKLYIKMNDIGKQNGILTLWVNEKKIYHSNSWIFRNKSNVHIKSVWLDTYIGGLTPSKFNTYILMDNLKIQWWTLDDK